MLLLIIYYQKRASVVGARVPQMMGPSPGVFRALIRDFVDFVVVLFVFWLPHGHVGSQSSTKGSSMHSLDWKHGNSEAPGKSLLGTLRLCPKYNELIMEIFSQLPSSSSSVKWGKYLQPRKYNFNKKKILLLFQ